MVVNLIVISFLVKIKIVVKINLKTGLVELADFKGILLCLKSFGVF